MNEYLDFLIAIKWPLTLIILVAILARTSVKARVKDSKLEVETKPEDSPSKPGGE